MVPSVPSLRRAAAVMRDASGPPSGWLMLRSCVWRWRVEGVVGGVGGGGRTHAAHRQLRAHTASGGPRRAGLMRSLPRPVRGLQAIIATQPSSPSLQDATGRLKTHLDDLHDVLGELLASVVLLDPGVRVHSKACIVRSVLGALRGLEASPTKPWHPSRCSPAHRKASWLVECLLPRSKVDVTTLIETGRRRNP